MTEGERTTYDQTSKLASQIGDGYIQYIIRIRKESLAAQGLPRHTQRFNNRYEAGWIATLVEEFYVLLDGPDPRASLIYPLLYHLFESSRQTPMIPSSFSNQPVSEVIAPEDEVGEAIDLVNLQDMSENLRGYLEE